MSARSRSRAPRPQVWPLRERTRAGCPDRKSTRLNSSHSQISYAAFCLKKKNIDIVYYCTGRGECYVAEGVMRKYVRCYAVLFQLGERQIFIARRNPEVGENTSTDV